MESSAQPSLTTPENNPCSLAPPLYLQVPNLYARIQAHLWAPQRGLRNAERVVLGAVFRNMPATFLTSESEGGSTITGHHTITSFVDRVLTLDVLQLRLLAQLCTMALLDAHSWGGRRPTEHSTGSYPIGTPNDPITLFTPLFTALGLSHIPGPVDTEPPATLSTASSIKRNLRQKANCIHRHDNCCPISLRSATTLSHAHIIPHSIVSDPQSSAPFWMFLTIILGPAMRDRFWDILAGGATYTTMNSITLTQDLHTYFDTGLLHLAPLPLQEPFNYATCKSYDVVLHWYHDDEELKTWTTQLPELPEQQVVGDVKLSYHKTTVRALKDRDVFRLYTNHPDTLPLVHPLLLELHGVVWKMIIESGLGESVASKKRSRAEAGIDGGGDSPRRPGSVKGSRGKRGQEAKRTEQRSGESSRRDERRRAGDGTNRTPRLDIHPPQHDTESLGITTTATNKGEDQTTELNTPGRTSERTYRKLFALESCSEQEYGCESSAENSSYSSEQDEVEFPTRYLTMGQRVTEKIRRQLYALDSCSDSDDEVYDVPDKSNSEIDDSGNPWAGEDLDRVDAGLSAEDRQAEKIRRKLFALEEFDEGGGEMSLVSHGNSDESNGYDSDSEGSPIYIKRESASPQHGLRGAARWYPRVIYGEFGSLVAQYN